MGIGASGSSDMSSFWGSDVAKSYAAKPSDPYGKADAERYDAAKGYGVAPSVLAIPGVTKGAVASYMDRSASDPFRAKMNGDMAALAARETPRAGYSSFGPGGYMTAATLGPMATASASKLDQSYADAIRAKQMAQLARLSSIASGATKGAGVEQLDANLVATKAANASMAGSGAGRFNVGAGLRGLADRNADASQAKASAAGMVGVQDKLEATNALASLASGTRAADMGAANADADLAARTAFFNAGADNSAGMARAGFAQNTGLFNADAAQKQYGMNHAVNMANLEASLRAQGLNDQAIAARMEMLGQQINRDRSDAMSFWDYSSGTRKFDATFQYQKDLDEARRTAERYAQAGQGAAWAGANWPSSEGDGVSQGGWGGSKPSGYGYDSGLEGMADSYYGKKY